MPGLIQPHPVELVVSHKSIFSRKLLETEFLASNFPPPRKAVVPSSDETKLTAFLWRNYRSTPLTNSNLIERKPMRGKELSPLFSLNGLDGTPSLATRNFNISTLQVKLRPPSRGRILFLFDTPSFSILWEIRNPWYRFVWRDSERWVAGNFCSLFWRKGKDRTRNLEKEWRIQIQLVENGKI